MLYTPKDRFARRAALKMGFRASRASYVPNLTRFFSRVKPVRATAPLIRIGAENDGGYLLPDDLEGVTRCYSPGVSTMCDFERDLADRGIMCHLADHSVDGPPLSHPLLDFRKKFIGVVNDDVHVRFDDWVQETSQPSDDLLLQMDIEGAEWSVLNTISPALLARFRIIVLEMHYLDCLFDPFAFEVIDATFQLLTSLFAVVHIHPNNNEQPLCFKNFSVPPVMEFTFVRRDRLSQQVPETHFPHPLDQPNISGQMDFPLPPCWYR